MRNIWFANFTEFCSRLMNSEHSFCRFSPPTFCSFWLRVLEGISAISLESLLFLSVFLLTLSVIANYDLTSLLADSWPCLNEEKPYIQFVSVVGLSSHFIQKLISKGEGLFWMNTILCIFCFGPFSPKCLKTHLGSSQQ